MESRTDVVPSPGPPRWVARAPLVARPSGLPPWPGVNALGLSHGPEGNIGRGSMGSVTRLYWNQHLRAQADL